MFTAVALTLVMSATFLMSDSSQAVEAIDLQSADSYAILAGGAFTDGATTSILGNISAASGPITGTAETYAEAMTDLKAAYVAAALVETTVITANPNPTTFIPGAYYQAAALTYAADTELTFDAGDVGGNAVFLIRTDGALGIGADATVTLLNGASEDNIYWHVTGATTIGANAEFSGTVLTEAAITVGANATVRGRLLSTAGAVTLGASSKIYSFDPPPAPTLRSLIVDLEEFNAYAILAGGAFTDGATTSILGNISAASGPITGTAETYAEAMTDLKAAYVAAALVETTVITANPNPTTFIPGAYYQAAALTYAADTELTFDAGEVGGNAVFLIRTDGALGIGADATVTLLNGASEDNIYWHVTGATTIGANAEFSGTVLTEAAITVGANATVRGRLLSTAGAVTLGASSKIHSYDPIARDQAAQDALAAEAAAIAAQEAADALAAEAAAIAAQEAADALAAEAAAQAADAQEAADALAAAQEAADVLAAEAAALASAQEAADALAAAQEAAARAAAEQEAADALVAEAAAQAAAAREAADAVAAAQAAAQEAAAQAAQATEVLRKALAAEAEEVRVYGPKVVMTFAPTPSLLVTQVIPLRENVVLQIAVVPAGPIAGGDASLAAQY